MLFTSTSGLIGNIGQANYAAAKLGVMGLSRIVAMEGLQKNVRSNIIAPFAWTRMIASIPVKDEASAARVERMKTGHARRPGGAAGHRALRRRAPRTPPARSSPCAATKCSCSTSRGRCARMARLEGWTPQTLIDQALPALKANYTDVGASASVFPYDPV